MRLSNPLMNEIMPWAERHDEWLTVSEYAERMGKSAQTVRLWCNNGFLLEIGCLVYRDPMGRWYIKPAN